MRCDCQESAINSHAKLKIFAFKFYSLKEQLPAFKQNLKKLISRIIQQTFHYEALSLPKQMDFFCVDSLTNLPCTLDTSTSISIFPNIHNVPSNLPVPWLHTTDNESMRILGTIYRTIKIGSNTYSWTFFTANIDHIILGTDFISSLLLSNHS